MFVDTSGLLAIMSAADRWHDDAVRTFRSIAHEELVTTNYVVVEALQLTRRRLGAVATETLRTDHLPLLTVAWIDELTHTAALHAYRPAGGPSIVDEASFVVMRRLGIDTAFAYDDDFERQGFRRAVPTRDEPTRWLREAPAPYGSAEDPDLVGIREIATRSGHSANTVQSWRRRHREFPAPLAQLSAAPIWRWPDVEAWISARR